MIKKERMLRDVINIGPIFEWFAHASMVCWENLPFLETLQTMVDKINFYIIDRPLFMSSPAKHSFGPHRTMAKIGALIQRMVTAEENRGYSVPLRGLPYV